MSSMTRYLKQEWRRFMMLNCLWLNLKSKKSLSWWVYNVVGTARRSIVIFIRRRKSAGWIAFWILLSCQRMRWNAWMIIMWRTSQIAWHNVFTHGCMKLRLVPDVLNPKTAKSLIRHANQWSWKIWKKQNKNFPSISLRALTQRDHHQIRSQEE